MVKKKGYALLLLMTKLFTAVGIVLLVAAVAGVGTLKALPSSQLIMLLLLPYFASAIICIARKRFFTVAA